MKDSANADFNVIIADTDWETFELLSSLVKNYNILNLSSDFAVSFILEYEKVNVLIISERIANLENIFRLCQKKKTKIFVFGKDLSYPPKVEEIEGILEEENNARKNLQQKNRKNLRELFNCIFKNTDVSKKIGSNNSIEKTAEDSLTESVWMRSPENEKEIQPDQSDNKKQFVAGSDDKKILLKNTCKEKSEVRIISSDGKTLEDSINKKNGDNKEDIKSTTQENAIRIDTEEKKFDRIIAIKQKIIVFIKAKGGVGSTVLSLFIAFKFSRLRTLLVDLNFSEGGSDSGYYLELPKIPNINFFTEGYNRAALESSIIKVEDNFDLLQPPPTYELSRKIDLQDIYSLIDIARKKYHLIIFDLPNHIDDIYLGVIDMADLAILVSDLSFGSIGRLSDINKRFIYNDLEKILVLNKSRNGNGVDLALNNFNPQAHSLNLVSLKENEILSGRTQFKKFNFHNLQEFEIFEKEVLSKLMID